MPNIIVLELRPGCRHTLDKLLRLRDAALVIIA
jgi:hypothetical protein